jgi:predicted alpha/beta hydrolase family esterase
MVAPPEVDFFPLDERVARFAPTPTEPLPFSSRLIASRNDPWMGFHTARSLARRWGSEFVDAGEVGHINAESRLGDWSFGRQQLAALLSSEEGTRAFASSTGTSKPAQADSLGELRG